MVSQRRTLLEIYEDYKALSGTIYYTRKQFQISGNPIHFQVQQYAEEQLKFIKQEKEELDRFNFEEQIRRISGDPYYPHAIKTFMEDEYPELKFDQD